MVAKPPQFCVDMLPVMITIDPERDDPAMLKEYLQGQNFI